MRSAIAVILGLVIISSSMPFVNAEAAAPAPLSAPVPASPSSSSNPLIQEMVDALSRWDLYSIDYRLQNISQPDRRTGSQNYMNAINFLKDHVLQNGQPGHVRVEIEPFTNSGSPLRNILVFVEGSDPVKRNERVYLSGHPDTVANAPGANDDGSGTSAAMLGCIIASRYVMNRTLVCGGWDAEEIGLIGSDRHAANASNAGVKVHGMVTMDMIGYDTDNSRQIFARDYAKSRWIGDAVVKANSDYGIGLNVVREDAATVDSRSDHVSFNKYGFHALVFRQKQVWDGNPNYHKPTDTISTMNLQTWEMTARAALATVMTLAEPTGKYGSGAVETIKVTPPTASISIGQTQQFAATAYDAGGNPVGATFTWGASGGTADAGGKYTPSAPGTFTVYANTSGKTGTATVTVGAATLGRIEVMPTGATVKSGATTQFTAQGFDTLGNPMAIAPQWSASGGSVDGTGLFTGKLVGSFLVYANQSGLSGSAAVSVTVGDAASISVTPVTATIRADKTQQFTARVLDAEGNEVTGAAVAWSALEGTVLNGLYTPNKVGSWKVQAVAGALMAEATVTVTPGPLADVKIEPASAEVAVGAKQAFAFKAWDVKQNPIAGLTGTWEVDAAVGTIDSGGLFSGTASGDGKVKVTVVSEGVTKTAGADVKVTSTGGPGPGPGPGPGGGGNATGGLFGNPLNLLLMALVVAAVVIAAAVAVAAKRKKRRSPPGQEYWQQGQPPQW